MFDLETSDADFVIDADDGTVADALSSAPKMGASYCSKCTCKVYENANTGNDYCACGHSYTDHW